MGFKGGLCFFNLTENIIHLLRILCPSFLTLLLSANLGIDFRELSQNGLSNMAPIGGLPVEFEHFDPFNKPFSVRSLLEG